MDAERFSGDGSTLSFTLSRTVSFPTDIEVVVENVIQEPTVSYNVLGRTLTFTEAPPTGTFNVYIVYLRSNSDAQVTLPDGSVTYAKLANNIRIFTSDNLTPNGNNAVFTLTEQPADANTVFVTVDGVVQRAPIHYTVSGKTITFSSNPPALSNVHVRHLGFRTTTTVTTLAANSTLTQVNLVGQTNVTGNVIPSANTTYDLGSSVLRWNNIYTGDLHLSNEGKPDGNMVDGTKGNWTIQEGEESLYIINNLSGKKYKFSLKEIK